MSDNCVDLPLQFNGARFRSTSLYNSIAMQVGIIVSTPLGSVQCDPEFGTAQLAPDKPLTEMGAIKDDLARTVREAIEKNELRLVKVNVKVQGGPKPDKSGLSPLRVEVTGVIGSTGDPFKLAKTLSEDYYRSPFPGRVG
jgi:phage baseplate assembly protein W